MTSDVISYEELRRVQALERDEKSLQEIENSFFEKVINYIHTKEKIIEENKGSDNIFSEQAIEKNKRELENIKKIIIDICERRRRKIVNQALNNISARVHNTENMLPEEEELYSRTIEFVKEYTDSFLSKFEKKEEEITPKEEQTETGDNFKKLKIVEKMPEFMWKDGKKYGPFELDDIVSVEEEVGEILIKGGKAIEIRSDLNGHA